MRGAIHWSSAAHVWAVNGNDDWLIRNYKIPFSLRSGTSKKRIRVSLTLKSVLQLKKKHPARSVKSVGGKNGRKRGSKARKATSRQRRRQRLRCLENEVGVDSFVETNSPNFRSRTCGQLQSRMKLMQAVSPENPIHVTFPCFNCDSRLSTLSSHFIQLQQPDSVGAPLHND